MESVDALLRDVEVNAEGGAHVERVLHQRAGDCPVEVQADGRRNLHGRDASADPSQTPTTPKQPTTSNDIVTSVFGFQKTPTYDWLR
eukprot:592627-Pyramimonas_sp.AAC.1